MCGESPCVLRVACVTFHPRAQDDVTSDASEHVVLYETTCCVALDASRVVSPCDSGQREPLGVSGVASPCTFRTGSRWKRHALPGAASCRTSTDLRTGTDRHALCWSANPRAQRRCFGRCVALDRSAPCTVSIRTFTGSTNDTLSRSQTQRAPRTWSEANQTHQRIREALHDQCD